MNANIELTLGLIGVIAGVVGAAVPIWLAVRRKQLLRPEISVGFGFSKFVSPEGFVDPTMKAPDISILAYGFKTEDVLQTKYFFLTFPLHIQNLTETQATKLRTQFDHDPKFQAPNNKDLLKIKSKRIKFCKTSLLGRIALQSPQGGSVMNYDILRPKEGIGHAEMLVVAAKDMPSDDVLEIPFTITLLSIETVPQTHKGSIIVAIADSKEELADKCNSFARSKWPGGPPRPGIHLINFWQKSPIIETGIEMYLGGSTILTTERKEKCLLTDKDDYLGYVLCSLPGEGHGILTRIKSKPMRWVKISPES